MSYHKLVRDKIPDIISQNGEMPITRILSLEEFKVELEKKSKEELFEVLQSNGEERVEELADLLEVMISLAHLEGKSLEDIIHLCDEKRKERGGFQKRIYLSDVKKVL